MFGVNLIETGAVIKMLGLATQTYRHFLKPLFWVQGSQNGFFQQQLKFDFCTITRVSLCNISMQFWDSKTDDDYELCSNVNSNVKQQSKHLPTVNMT